MNKMRMMQVLRSEINRHISMALVCDELVMMRSHLEVAQVLLWAEICLEKTDSFVAGDVYE